MRNRQWRCEVIRVVSEPQVTIEDEIFEGYGRMIRTCVSWAVSEATRANPSECAREWLDDFIPNWREVYANHGRHSFALKDREAKDHSGITLKRPKIKRCTVDPQRSRELKSRGLSPQEIAKTLGISYRTAQRHLSDRRPK